MTFDIIVAGVGGQGVLSLSSIIAAGALDSGLHTKQSEVHGMAQRGGAVTAHLRLAAQPIASDLIPRGRASLIVSLEPLESLRYLEYLSPSGALITASRPVVNIPDYPDTGDLLAAIHALPRAYAVDAAALAKRAGLAQATNMVMAGAASLWLPLAPAAIERSIERRFAAKGTGVVDRNLAAFRAGRQHVEALCAAIP